MAQALPQFIPGLVNNCRFVDHGCGAAMLVSKAGEDVASARWINEGIEA